MARLVPAIANQVMDVLWVIWKEMGIDDSSEESKLARHEYVKDELKNKSFVYRDLDNELRPSTSRLDISC